mgnify:CR=1 FL=1
MDKNMDLAYQNRYAPAPPADQGCFPSRLLSYILRRVNISGYPPAIGGNPVNQVLCRIKLPMAYMLEPFAL